MLLISLCLFLLLNNTIGYVYGNRDQQEEQSTRENNVNDEEASIDVDDDDDSGSYNRLLI